MTLFDQYPAPAHCPHPKGEPAVIIKSNGDRLAFMRCVDCDSPVEPGHWIAHGKLADMGYHGIDTLPVWRDDRDQVPPCSRCGALGAETHHTYPRAIDGAEEADRWPTIWLCRRCHNLWHIRLLRAALDGRLGNPANDEAGHNPPPTSP